ALALARGERAAVIVVGGREGAEEAGRIVDAGAEAVVRIARPLADIAAEVLDVPGFVLVAAHGHIAGFILIGPIVHRDVARFVLVGPVVYRYVAGLVLVGPIARRETRGDVIAEGPA